MPALEAPFHSAMKAIAQVDLTATRNAGLPLPRAARAPLQQLSPPAIRHPGAREHGFGEDRRRGARRGPGGEHLRVGASVAERQGFLAVLAAPSERLAAPSERLRPSEPAKRRVCFPQGLVQRRMSTLMRSNPRSRSLSSGVIDRWAVKVRLPPKQNARLFCKPGVALRFCGEGGIRTLGRISPTSA